MGWAFSVSELCTEFICLMDLGLSDHIPAQHCIHTHSAAFFGLHEALALDGYPFAQFNATMYTMLFDGSATLASIEETLDQNGRESSAYPFGERTKHHAGSLMLAEYCPMS